MTMQQPPPMPLHRINDQDESHLKLISVLHFVMGGIYLLFIGFVILHFVIMSTVLRMAETQSQKNPPAPVVVAPEFPATETPDPLAIPPSPTAPAIAPAPNPFPKEIIPFMIGMYVVIGLFLVALCTCNVISGFQIRKKKGRVFSFIIAGVNCMQFPLGTSLGVFTFIVLSRPSVKMSYDANLQV